MPTNDTHIVIEINGDLWDVTRRFLRATLQLNGNCVSHQDTLSPERGILAQLHGILDGLFSLCLDFGASKRLGSRFVSQPSFVQGVLQICSERLIHHGVNPAVSSSVTTLRTDLTLKINEVCNPLTELLNRPGKNIDATPLHQPNLAVCSEEHLCIMGWVKL